MGKAPAATAERGLSIWGGTASPEDAHVGTAHALARPRLVRLPQQEPSPPARGRRRGALRLRRGRGTAHLGRFLAAERLGRKAALARRSRRGADKTGASQSASVTIIARHSLT